MKNKGSQEWPVFFTATIADWKLLLQEAKYKQVIIDSFTPKPGLIPADKIFL